MLLDVGDRDVRLSVLEASQKETMEHVCSCCCCCGGVWWWWWWLSSSSSLLLMLLDVDDRDVRLLMLLYNAYECHIDRDVR